MFFSNYHFQKKEPGILGKMADSKWSKKCMRVSSICCDKKIEIYQRLICFTDYAKAFDCVDHNQLCKILKEMGIPDHLTCLLRNLYAAQEATVRTGHGTTDWFQIGKGVCQGYILSSCLFNFYAE